MAKKKSKKQVKPTWGKNPDEMLDGAFLSSVGEARKYLHRDDILVGSEAERLIVGLPLPSLALRYLCQNTVFALGRVVEIVGVEGTVKSALLFEIYRWHCVYGGGCVHIENENKDSPVLRHSILEYNPAWIKRMLYVPTDTVDEWNKAVAFYVQHFKTLMDVKPGPGRTIPVCIGVDSLTATSTEAMAAKFDKDGATPRESGREVARKIADFMRQKGTLHRGYPITMAATNHLKIGKDARGMAINQIPGGTSVNFMSTLMIKMAHAHQGKDINLVGRKGLRVVLKAIKNSLGPSRKQITAEFIWWNEYNQKNEIIQRHRWDWETASIELLLAFESTCKADWNAIKEIVDLYPVSRRHPRTIASDALGVSKESPVSYREAGAMLETRLDLMHRLYPILGINSGSYFKPGEDYRTMEREMAEKGAQEAALLYSQAPNNMPANAGVPLPESPDDALPPTGAEEEMEALPSVPDLPTTGAPAAAPTPNWGENVSD